MRRSLLPISLILGSLLGPSMTVGQLTMMDKTPELARLEVFLGTWTRTGEPPPEGRPGPVSARITASWGPGSVWMTWEARIEFSTGQVLMGRRQMAWDAELSAYRSSWIDTQSARIILSEGRWMDEATLEIIGEPIPWPDGRSYRFKTRYRVITPDAIQETGWRSVDGGPYHEHQVATWTKVAK